MAKRKPLLIPLVAGFDGCVKLNPEKLELLTEEKQRSLKEPAAKMQTPNAEKIGAAANALAMKKLTE